MALAALPAMVACGAVPAGTAGGDGASRAGPMPPVHVAQIVELVTDGVNGKRWGYDRQLADCTAGGLATTPLSAQDAARVGKTRYQLWMDDRGDVISEESWDVELVGPPGTCHFQLATAGRHESVDARQTVQIDLATGDRTEEPSSPDAVARYPADPSDMDVRPGVTGPVRRSVLGQPCNQWTSEHLRNRQCVWSGGQAWGFSAGPENDEYRPSRFLIVLEQAPYQGAGYRVATETMTVGVAFDRDTLQTPKTANHPPGERR